MTKKIIPILIIATTLAGCAERNPLTQYRPVVDTKRTNSVVFEKDLNECREIALKVEADYKKKQEEELAKNVTTGIIVGAIAGAAIGDSRESIATGAAIGGLAGAAANDYTHDLVKYGPRRVVDRCMTNRGHKILNDIGKG